MHGECRWYALRVRCRLEPIVAMSLRSKGVEEFLPAYVQKRVLSDRIKRVQRPLFPGYLFSRFALQDRLTILTTPGVMDIVGSRDIPEAVPDEEINVLRRFVDSKLPICPWPCLRVGQRVLVERGPLAGVEGILVEFRKDYRLIVSVTLLQRSVSAEIEAAWVTPVRADQPGVVGGIRREAASAGWDVARARRAAG